MAWVFPDPMFTLPPRVVTNDGPMRRGYLPFLYRLININ